MSRLAPVTRSVILGALALCVTLLGCATAADQVIRPGESVEITLSSSAAKATLEANGHPYRLSLKQIVDSRCPANAKCIWAGELSARIAVERVDQRGAVREVTLGESTVPAAEVMELRLDLVEIDEKSVTFAVAEAVER